MVRSHSGLLRAGTSRAPFTDLGPGGVFGNTARFSSEHVPRSGCAGTSSFYEGQALARTHLLDCRKLLRTGSPPSGTEAFSSFSLTAAKAAAVLGSHNSARFWSVGCLCRFLPYRVHRWSVARL